MWYPAETSGHHLVLFTVILALLRNIHYVAAGNVVSTTAKDCIKAIDNIEGKRCIKKAKTHWEKGKAYDAQYKSLGVLGIEDKKAMKKRDKHKKLADKFSEKEFQIWSKYHSKQVKS